MLVYNVHKLVHIADDAKMHGQLDNISAFSFENLMRKLTKAVRKPSMTLWQVIRRWYEARTHGRVKQAQFFQKARVQKEHSARPVPQGMQYDSQFKEA